MADERNRWLDKAAAERVLRGGPAAPGADRRAQEAEARLRAALDMLAAPQPPAGVELPGEAAAVAAFRAAHGGAVAGGASGVASAPGLSAISALPGTPGPVGVDATPLVELGTAAAPLTVAASRRGRPARFALVAALAGVAVGSLAVAAGAGLLDRVTHDTAGPAPAVSLSADENPTTAGDTAGPTLAPQLRPTPLRGTDGSEPGLGTAQTPGADAGAVQGFGTGTGTGPGTSSGGGAGSGDAGGTGTRDGKDTSAGGTTSLKDADNQNRLKAVDLCEAYRSGHMTSDRRERLSKLAQGLARIPQFCEALLDGPIGSGAPAVPRTADDGSPVLKAPTFVPASPVPSSAAAPKPR
ncbi:hypothetical protein [Streptomyces sp. KS 21]|uniref:hypothetical protein n=1 Tax=Streptomyces sp. KS 21 TaxID=2485150 RepID=UPI0010631EBC|nr:hypothetical protein [Streptomyces sp. KS 21]TDU76415.1 hypothetical protein EDD91_3124 [Streptomyces sp. KS 21]